MIEILLWVAGVGFVGIVGCFIYVMATATRDPPDVPSPYGMLQGPSDTDLFTARAMHPAQERTAADASETGDKTD